MNWRFRILKRIWTPGVGLPLPWGIIHVYNHHNIQRSSLKQLGQSVTFYRKHQYEGETIDYKSRDQDDRHAHIL